VHLIKELMAKSTELGMQTLDQSLVQSYKDGLISKEDAIRFADSANDVRLQIKMFEKGQFGTDAGLGLSFDEPDDQGQFLGR
jgi:twitching motility protein PilU